MAAVGLFILAGFIVIFLEWDGVKQAITHANWFLTPIAVVFSGLAYFILGVIFLSISRLFNLKVKSWDLIKIGYVSNVMDNLLPGVGLPGLSLTVLLLRRRGTGTAEAIAPSLFRSYFDDVVFIAILPLPLIYILTTHPLPRTESIALIVTTILVVLFAAVTSIMVFSGKVRRGIMGFVIKTWRSITKKDLSQPLTSFAQRFGDGVDRIRRHPKQVFTVIILLILYWLTAALVVWFCFFSLGSYLDFSVVLTGFLISRISGVISFLPGGLGTQDATMVGFYTLFGIPVAQSILIAILFRVVYYFIPFIASIGFYRNLLKSRP